MLKLPTFVGFDSLFDQMERMSSMKTPNWPPYNIRKTEDNKYVIEMAVAGFGKNDIEVTLDDDKLVIKGNIQKSAEDTNFLYKGIAERAFEQTFTVADQIVIKDATLLNGMLKIWYEFITPAKNKPKQIAVKSEE